ncbi:MAG: preprotein translocase subunit SecE [Clostridia bacterium]|nr:preprotein translocase subunit SecE [Clostridia bacterium]
MAEIENKNISADEAKAEKPSKAEKKAKKANDKPGFFARLGKWFKSVKSEFKKITWSSRKSTFKNFGIVMAIVIASAIVIGVVDVGLGAMLRGLRDLCNL